MAFDPELSFTLRVNDKGDNPKRPDYRGLVTVQGVTYEMAGWKRKKDDGSVVLSGKLKPKEQPKPQTAPKEAPKQHEDDEDMPFG